MRRLYPDLLLRRLARGDLLFPLRAARSAIGALLGEARPVLGTLVVTYRCDLACGMCDLPRRGDRARELGTPEMLGIVDALADLGCVGVGVTGGEPLLRKDLLPILRRGARRGMLMHVNTNGSLVDGEAARALAGAGVASVNVSLDAPDAATHDRLRGRSGSFARALRAAAALAALPPPRPRVALTCALGPGNAASAGALLPLARDLGVDRVGFLPLHRNDGMGAVPDAAAAAAGRRLAALAESDPLVDNSPEYLALFPAAFAGGGSPVRCSAPRTSIVVDCYGDVFPCVPLNAARKPVGSGDPRRVWRSRAYRAARASLAGCRACLWNCHTEMNLALRRVGARA